MHMPHAHATWTGRIEEATRKTHAVVRRAAAAEYRVPLYRVTYTHCQCLYASLDYAATAQALSPLVAPASRYTAKAMALAHQAAAFAAVGDGARARETLRALCAVAATSGGKLDAQLAQRARAWLARPDGYLPMAALELHYFLQYYHGGAVDRPALVGYAAHAHCLLRPALSPPHQPSSESPPSEAAAPPSEAAAPGTAALEMVAGELEPRLASRDLHLAPGEHEPRLAGAFLEGALLAHSHIPYPPSSPRSTPHEGPPAAGEPPPAAAEEAVDGAARVELAISRLRSAAEGARASVEYGECADRWV